MCNRAAKWRVALARIDAGALAAFVACSLMITPAVLGISLQRTQSEQNDARTELEVSEQARPATCQLRRHLRGKLNPAFAAGTELRTPDIFAAHARSFAAPPANLSPDSWTLPPRL